jgi:replicative DNA helicase
MDATRKSQLQQATRNACIAFTQGMTKAQLMQRLADVKAKVASSRDHRGQPLPGHADRIAACNEEIARLTALIG